MQKDRGDWVDGLRRRNNRVLQLDYVELIDDDIEWLDKTERLTLTNVKAPPGLLARIETLWWLDIRCSTAADLAIAQGISKLQFLRVWHSRAMQDLSVMSEMTTLRYIDLYALPKLTEFPSCAPLVNLEHARVGQMLRLASLRGLLQAPNLRELNFTKKINVSDADVDEILRHPAINAFSWSALDVPNKVWAPVVNRIRLPEVPLMHPEQWFHLPEHVD